MLNGDEKSLDVLLANEAQQAVRLTVAALPEDMPSMAWRAQLNERLMQIAPPVRQSPWSRVWRPALGVGLAGILAVMMVTPPRPSRSAGDSASLEASLAQLHEQSNWSVDFARDEVSPTTAGNSWTESDIDLL